MPKRERPERDEENLRNVKVQRTGQHWHAHCATCEEYDRWCNENRTRSYDNFLTSDLYKKKFLKYTTIYSYEDGSERDALSASQLSFTGPTYILSSQSANLLLSDLGMQDILNRMNGILGTDRILTSAMERLLEFCLDTFSDFGQAYAVLRPRWYMHPSVALDNIEKRKKEDKELWSKSLEDRIASNIEWPPMRLWDLWSNRVVPLWVAQVERNDEAGKWMSVYHSRVDKRRQQCITSPINGREWPIPIPIDTSLEQIRIDLLRVGTQCNIKFAWIDILCQRQAPEGMSSEEAHSEIDVPTEWPFYSRAEWIIFYLNGLSSPFEASSSEKLHDQQSEDRTLDRSYDEVLQKSVDWAQWHTIHSCVNKAEREKLEVEHQKSFTGPSYILSSEIADTLLSDLGLQGMLNWMNVILGTDRVFSPTMRLLLLFCMCTFADFGQAYSLLRPRWNMDPSEALENIETRRKEDQKLRLEALENDIVVKPRIPPRRVWDIWSNRVIPFWVVEVGEIRESEHFAIDMPQRRNWLAISHSWMHNNHRHNVDSPINGHEWPIPIPVDSSLERIRIELLNLAAERNIHIVWLDVLCLRQEGVESKESLRRAEWKLDVPTIGPIYDHADRVVYYFSGLGRPFTAPTDMNDSRHWMNRAWTLQETRQRLIIAGRSFSSSPDIPYAADLGSLDRNEWQKSIDKSGDVMKALMMSFLKHNELSVWTALKLMQHRIGTSELDKIAGLVYRLNCFEPPLPAYIVGENIEEAWDRLIKATRSAYRAELFFFFPEPGKGGHKWYPTWQQIKSSSTIPNFTLIGGAEVEFDETSDGYIISGCYCLEDCLVEGLPVVQIGRQDGSSTPSREEKVQVGDKYGVKHDIWITADLETPIADGYYTLVGDGDSWVIARKTRHGLIEKISVIKIVNWIALDNIAVNFGFSTLRLA